MLRRSPQPNAPPGGGGPFAGGSGGAGQTTTFMGATPLGYPLAPILANWLDNHMFVASTLIGFTVMERYPAMKVVVAHGNASWMQEVFEKMEASTRVIPLLHHYPVSTEPEELWEHGNVMLGFHAEERLIQKLPQDFADKVVWGSRYPHHNAMSAWDLNFESKRLLGPNMAGALSSIMPVLAVILGERIRGSQLLALAAIVVGIGLMYRVHVNLSARSLWLMALPLGLGRYPWGDPAGRQIRF